MSVALIIVIAIVVIALVALLATQGRKRRRRAVAQRHHQKADILYERAEKQRGEADRVRARARELDPDRN